ncbi:MAG: hypothetical protein IJU60_07015 [Acholeplasmatales bacterium]|nr:hypothetical protein [Acholeplasmatales bacterium]
MEAEVKQKRIKWKDRTPDNDIKYAGYLSYRHLRIIGWVCLAIAQIAGVMRLQIKLNPASQEELKVWMEIFGYISALPLPLFFLANYSQMTAKKSNFKSMFISYGGIALALYIVSNFIVIMHFGYRAMKCLDSSTSYADAFEFFGILLPAIGKVGYTLNIFIDLLLITFLFFFIYYEPKKFFLGKKKILFRLLVILPIIYEIGAIFIKYQTYFGGMEINSFVFFLLPSKPPLLFAAFVIIIFAVKIAEIRHIKKEGHSKETWEEYSKTHAHSLRVSICISVVFLICALLDFAAIIAAMLIISAQSVGYASDPYIQSLPYYEGMTVEQIQEYYINTKMSAFANAGFGGSVALILIIPLVILFSYTKTHKDTKIDKLLPIAGIGLIFVIYLEGMFQVVTGNIARIIQNIKDMSVPNAQIPGYFMLKVVLGQLPSIIAPF